MPPTSSTSASSAWRALLVAAAFVAILELCVAGGVADLSPKERGADLWLPGHQPTFTQAVLQAQVERLDALEGGADILVLGDSSCLTGIVPAGLDYLLGGHTENLCTIAPVGVQGHLLLLRRYLEGQPAPTLIIYQFALGTVSATPEDLAKAGLLPALNDWLGEDTAASRWPTHRLRGPARAALGDWLRADESNFDALAQFLRANQGFAIDPNDLAGTKGLRPDGRALPTPVDPAAAAALEQLLALAAGHGAQVLFVRSPIPLILRSEERLAALDQQAMWWTAFAARHQEATLRLPYARFVPTGSLRTYEHLTPEAALDYTMELAGEIPALLAPARR